MKVAKNLLPLGSTRSKSTRTAFRPLARLSAIALAVVILTACGGGGGGGESPTVNTPPVSGTPPSTPTPDPVGSARILSVTERPVIPAGVAVGEAEVVVEVAGAPVSGLTLQGANGPVPVPATVGITTVRVEVLGVSEQTVRLSQGTTTLATTTVTPTCATDSAWDAGVTDTCYPLVSYTNVVAARHAFNLYTRLTVERGIELAENQTGYDTPQWVIDNGGSRFGNCALLRDPQGENGVKKDAFGRLEMACTDALDLVIRPLRYDLVRNVFYSGGQNTIPVTELANDLNYISGCESIGPQPFADWGLWVEVPTGWFFIYTGPFKSQFPIYWQAKADPLPAPVMVEPESQFQWNLSCLKRFSFTAPGQ